MKTDIFQDQTKSLPKKDDQIVRIDMTQSDIGGRAGHMPKDVKSGVLGIQHVPNAGGKH
jgi:hypothetical protein